MGDRAPQQRSVIDWPELHRRVEQARQRLAVDATLSPERRREILAARARQVAGLGAPGAPVGETVALAIVEFSVARDTFAIESRFVREVLPLRSVAAVPWTPPFVLGAVNVRGRIVSVIELRRLFELPDGGLAESDKLLVVGDGAMEIGLRADRVAAARVVEAAALSPPPPTFTGLRASLCRGVTGGGLALLDAARLLAEPGLRIASNATRGVTSSIQGRSS